MERTVYLLRDPRDNRPDYIVEAMRSRRDSPETKEKKRLSALRRYNYAS